MTASQARAPEMEVPPDEGTAERASLARGARIRLMVQPTIVLILVASVLLWAFNRDLTATQQGSISISNIASLTWQHILLTVAVVVIVIVFVVWLTLFVHIVISLVIHCVGTCLLRCQSPASKDIGNFVDVLRRRT